MEVRQTTRRDVSYPVPDELSYAKDFVQLLVEEGWSVQDVRHSKFNSFFRETSKAAYIKTDRGTFEVVFFDRDDEVGRLQISEEPDADANYHNYILQTPKTDQRIEGGACYFTKRRNMLITTTDPELNKALDRLLAESHR